MKQYLTMFIFYLCFRAWTGDKTAAIHVANIVGKCGHGLIHVKVLYCIVLYCILLYFIGHKSSQTSLTKN